VERDAYFRAFGGFSTLGIWGMRSRE
jgi:hypothetical protein